MPALRPRPSTALRPRLRPAAVLLDRTDGELQIGLGPDAVVIADVDGMWRALFRRCLGRTSLSQLAAGSPLSTRTVRPVIDALASRRLVDLEPSSPVRRRGRLIGAGDLGAAIARLLPAAGLDTVYVVDPTPPDAARYPSSAARSQAEALCGRLDARRFRPMPHWSKPGGVDVAVTVVATGTLESDRAVTDDLVRADQPHLLVRPLPAGMVVGPLVVPGSTPCVRCCDLSRRDVDPAWPQLMRQLTRTAAEIDPVMLSWAAATVAVQVGGWLAGRAVDTMAATVELTLDDPRHRWRGWARHPDCSCHW